MCKDTPLKKIREKRSLSLRDLFFKINQEIKITRLSDINVGKTIINKKEIEILNKYLNLSEEEIEQLEEMKEDEDLKKACEMILKLSELVPKDLKAGETVIKTCPNCGSKLSISRAKLNGHLWIVCEKEGVLLCQ